jgi:hypothetical protein
MRPRAAVSFVVSLGLSPVAVTPAGLASGTPQGAPAARASHVGRAPVRRTHAAAPMPETKPAASAANVTLAITAPSARGRWTLHVTNEGEQPVRVVADARLLTLEVTPRSARAPVRCVLPDDMRPGGDLERAQVILPGRGYDESFEPRLYCFGAGKLDALVPGAIVIGRLGFSSRPASQPPFEVSSIEGGEPELAPLKSIESPPIALPDDPTAWAVPVMAGKDTADADTPRVSLQGPVSVDAASPNEIAIPLTLRNDGAHATVVRFRPEVLDFDIIGPGGVERCDWPTVPAAALPEMFTTLAPKAAETLEVTLSSYCTGHGLDQPGLIVVWPRLDTHDATGAELHMRSFDGEVVAGAPTIVRLHRGGARP